MQRAMQMYLNLPDTTRTHEDDDILLLERVVLLPQACQTLARQLDVRGHWQGGTLFGTAAAGMLQVRVATPLGPPTWPYLLRPHLSYLLGWSDSLSTQFGPTLDWYGNWIAAPDGQLPDERADLTWLAQGARRGLFDDRHALVVIGLSNFALTGRAYSWDEGEPVSLECSLQLQTTDTMRGENS